MDFSTLAMAGGSLLGGLLGGDSGADDMMAMSEEALELQKQIYDDSIKRSEPWYNAGKSAVDELMNLLGLSGGTGNQSRDQIYNEMLPQYTSNVNGGIPAGAQKMTGTDYYQLGGNVFRVNPSTGMVETAPANTLAQGKPVQWSPFGGGSSQIDYDALNAAVDERFGTQQTPDNFGALTDPFGADDLYDDPSYKFRIDEGNKAIERQLAAAGKTYSPEAVKALTEYNQNFAATEYNNSFNRDMMEDQNLYNMLAGVSGFGQTATGQMGAAGTNYANAGTDLYTGMGNVMAADAQAQALNTQSMFNTLGTMYKYRG
jgi:hypothetical protein